MHLLEAKAAAERDERRLDLGVVVRILASEELDAHAIEADSAPVRSLQALSRDLRIVIAVGTIEQASSARHVSHFILFPNGRLQTQRKHALTATEKGAGIVPGPEERNLFTVGGVRFGICICSDSGIPHIRNKLAAKGFTHGTNAVHVEILMHDLLGRLAMTDRDRRLLLAIFTKGVGEFTKGVENGGP